MHLASRPEQSLASLGLWLRVHACPTAEGGLSIFIRDITEQPRAEHERLIAQERLEHLALHDALTDLPNRVKFRQHIEHALLRVRRDAGAALLYLDLDRFKGVNDALGHAVGDMLPRAVADRLRACTRRPDLVARLGGDAFAIIQEGVRQPADVTVLSERLVEALRAPFAVQGKRVVIGASIGIALADGQATADEVPRSADIAMHRARTSGGDTWRFFEPAMDAELPARRLMERDLRRAFDQRQFALVYQPLIDATTGRSTGSRRCCGGATPSGGSLPPARSSRWPRKRG